MRGQTMWVASVVLAVAAGCGGSPGGGGDSDAGDGADARATDGAAYGDGPWPDGARPDGWVPRDGSAVGDPVPLESLCDEYVDAVCEHAAECGCEGGRDRCERAWRASCEGAAGLLDRAMRDAIEEGTVRYDAMAAARLVHRARETSARCAIPGAGDRTLDDLLTHYGVFEGTLGVGEACTAWGAGGECDGWCRELGDGVGECQAIAGPGERCNDTTRWCWDTDEPLQRKQNTFWPLRDCVEGDDGERRCQVPRENGDPCGNDGDCESWRCLEGRCEPAGELGATCTEHFHCASGHCDPTSDVCAPGDGPVGADCQRFAQCASKVCEEGRCRAALCAAIDSRGERYLDEDIDVPREPGPTLSSCDPAAEETPPCGIPSWVQLDIAPVDSDPHWDGRVGPPSVRIGQTAVLREHVVVPIVVFTEESWSEFDLALGIVDAISLDVDTHVVARALPSASPGTALRPYATTVGDRVLVTAPGYWGWIDPGSPDTRIEGDLTTVVEGVLAVGAADVDGRAVLAALALAGEDVVLETATAALDEAPAPVTDTVVGASDEGFANLMVGAVGDRGAASWGVGGETAFVTLDATGGLGSVRRRSFPTLSRRDAAQSYRLGDTLQRWSYNPPYGDEEPMLTTIDPALGDLSRREVPRHAADSTWLGDGYLLYAHTPRSEVHLTDEDGSDAWLAAEHDDLFPYRVTRGSTAITRVPCHGVVLSRITEHIAGRPSGETVLNAVFATCSREP